MYGDIQSLPLNFGQNLSQAFGLPNVNVDEVTSALTPMNPAGFASLGDATFIPLTRPTKCCSSAARLPRREDLTTSKSAPA